MAGHRVGKAIDEGGMGLDEGLVGEVTVGDEDDRVGGYIECEDGTILAATSRATTSPTWVVASRLSPSILHTMSY